MKIDVKKQIGCGYHMKKMFIFEVLNENDFVFRRDYENLGLELENEFHLMVGELMILITIVLGLLMM
jgi:hypothetical protein